MCALGCEGTSSVAARGGGIRPHVGANERGLARR